MVSPSQARIRHPLSIFTSSHFLFPVGGPDIFETAIIAGFCLFEEHFCQLFGHGESRVSGKRRKPLKSLPLDPLLPILTRNNHEELKDKERHLAKKRQNLKRFTPNVTTFSIFLSSIKIILSEQQLS